MYERGCADQPGTGLFALLSSVDPAEATDDELIDVVAGWERIKCFAEARQAAALVAFADRRPGGAAHGVSEFAADEIAPALSIARGTAEARIGFARGLTALPSTRAALASGRIGLGVAHRIVDGLSTSALSPEQVRAAEEQVLADAEGRTPAQVAARIARTVLALDPAATDRRHTEAVATRKVVCYPQPDGMAGIWALLRADDAAAVMSRLRSQATAAHAPGDDRTLDQRLADSLVDLHTGHLRNPVPAARVCTCTGQDRSAEKDRSRSRATNDAAEPFRPIGPAVKVVVAATTLLGLDEQPGELAGYGPIPAALARQIAAEPDGTWRRILTDPASGALLDVGRTSYRPPAALADHVRTRDRTCRFVGCRLPADRCDLDHIQRYPDGPTSAANLGTECRHHHRLKHETGWQLEGEPGEPGALRWTSPTGRTYTTRPRPPLDPV